MTQYIVTNSKTGQQTTVNATSRDHARLVAHYINPEHFTDGKDGVWLHTAEVRDAAARFRQVLAERLDGDPALSDILDLFQEALDEHRENALDDCAHSHY